MNDEYLKQFRRSPDSRFVEKIHVRLEGKERVQIIRRYSTHSVFALIFVFGMLITFSSTVRASLWQTTEQFVRGYLLCGLNLSANCEGDGILTADPSEYLSLDAAQARFASPVILPPYVPQGFERLADVAFFDLAGQPTLVVAWKRPNHYSLIKLLISHHSFEIKEYAQTLGKGAIEETVLDGKPAIIVRGVWNIGVRENDFMMTALMWRYDENTVYSLMSLEQAVPLNELIRMAESIP